MTNLARRALASLLSIATFALNPGWAAAAPVFRAPKVSAPKVQAAVPQLSPLALLPTPGSQVGLPLLAPVLQQSLAQQIEAVAAPNVSGADAHTAGANIQALIEGKPAAQLSSPVLGGGSSNGSSPLGPSSQPQLSAVENDRASYNKRRAALSRLAERTGIVASLPKAGAELSAKLLAEAGSKKVLFTDFDDTIGVFNSVLTPQMASALVAVKNAGKTVVVVTDRTDEKRPNSKMLTVFESLASIPAADRAGMYVAANNGGRIYKFDDNGEPVKLYEVPSIDAAEKAVIEQAAQAVKGRLSDIGTTQHPGDAVSPSESFNPYGYAMMLAVGTPEATVKVAAQALQAELAQRGIEVEVLARMAKDPKNPPYITYSRMNKSVPVGWLAKHLGATAAQAVAVGDAMFMPRLPASSDEAGKAEAERQTGEPMPLTGNETDRNMEKGLPGLMALSVGGTADPRMENAWVLDGKGPETTLKLLESLASRPAEPAPTKWENAGNAAAIIALIAGGVAGWYFFIKAFSDVFSGNVTTPVDPGGYYGPVPSWEDMFHVTGMAGLIGGFKKISRQTWEKIGTGLLLALSTAGALGVWFLLFKSIADTASGNVSAPVLPEGVPYMPVDGGWERLFQMTGLAGAAGMVGMMMKPNLMPNPSRDYGLALKQALELARERGYTDDQVYFGGATASLPRRQGEEWKYAFYLSRDPGAKSAEVLYVDIVTGYTSTPDFRKHHYANAPLPRDIIGLHKLSVELGPEQALDAARKAIPRFGAAASVSLSPRGTYTLYDNAGNVAAVDALEGAVIALKVAPAKQPSTLGPKLAKFLHSWWAVPLAIPLAMGAAMLTGQTLMAVGAVMAVSAVGVHVFGKRDLVWAEFFLLYGGLATMMTAGILGAVAAAVIGAAFSLGSLKPVGVSEADIESAAKSVISYKGGVWSQTEYNMGYYNTLESLKSRGATEAQLARFKQLCDEAPIKGGRFNPWSGD